MNDDTKHRPLRYLRGVKSLLRSLLSPAKMIGAIADRLKSDAYHDAMVKATEVFDAKQTPGAFGRRWLRTKRQGIPRLWRAVGAGSYAECSPNERLRAIRLLAIMEDRAPSWRPDEADSAAIAAFNAAIKEEVDIARIERWRDALISPPHRFKLSKGATQEDRDVLLAHCRANVEECAVRMRVAL